MVASKRMSVFVCLCFIERRAISKIFPREKLTENQMLNAFRYFRTILPHIRLTLVQAAFWCVVSVAYMSTYCTYEGVAVVFISNGVFNRTNENYRREREKIPAENIPMKIVQLVKNNNKTACEFLCIHIQRKYSGISTCKQMLKALRVCDRF